MSTKCFAISSSARSREDLPVSDGGGGGQQQKSERMGVFQLERVISARTATYDADAIVSWLSDLTSTMSMSSVHCETNSDCLPPKPILYPLLSKTDSADTAY